MSAASTRDELSLDGEITTREYQRAERQGEAMAGLVEDPVGLADAAKGLDLSKKAADEVPTGER